MSNPNSRSITMIKSNPLDYDPRLTKEVNALINKGYKVTLICWDRSGKDFNNNSDNYNEIKFRFKAPYGPKIVFFIIFWWAFEFYNLLKVQTDFIHVININCILPAFFAAKIRNKKLVYEMFDTHENRIKGLPHSFRQLLIRINKFFMSSANAVIIADESRVEELKGIPNDNLIVIYNSPPDLFTEYKEEKANNVFTIFFAGGLEKYKSLETMTEIVQDMEGIKLIIAGFGSLSDEIKKISNDNPDKIEYIGKISYNEVLERTLASDLLFSLYDNEVPSFKYASSNKLFEAMMCSKPILVSEGTSMVRIVEKSNCGIIVDCKNSHEIESQILYLRNNPKICSDLGKNGRMAYERTYSWGRMRERLFQLYHDLEKQNR